jgi:integrase
MRTHAILRKAFGDAVLVDELIPNNPVERAKTKTIRAYSNPKEGLTPSEPLPHARVHDLRHIHATTLLLAGVPVHVVAARLGHADPAITLRVYAHVIRSAEIAAAEVFARVMAETA